MTIKTFMPPFLLLLVITTTMVQGQAVDLRPIDIHLEQTGIDTSGTRVYDVWIGVEMVLTDAAFGIEFPLDYQFSVNSVVAGESKDEHKVFHNDACDNTPPACGDVCGTLVTHGTKFTQVFGLCPLKGEDCECTITQAAIKKAYWPLEDIPIPDDAECSVLLDPDGLVLEFDETNNELIIQAPDHPIPTLSGWGMIALLLLLATGLFVVRHWRRPQQPV